MAHSSCGGELPVETPNGQFAFPSKWEKKGYNKTVDLLLDMTEPIHRTGKVVTGDSGFCVTAGVTALHAHGVFGQFLIAGTGHKRSPVTKLMNT